jgi:hypothetical protein
MQGCPRFFRPLSLRPSFDSRRPLVTTPTMVPYKLGRLQVLVATKLRRFECEMDLRGLTRTPPKACLRATPLPFTLVWESRAKVNLEGIVFFHRPPQELQIPVDLAIGDLAGTVPLQFRL